MPSPNVQRVLDLLKHAGDSSEVLYGPGHIVFDDYNLGDNSILFCLEPQRWIEHFNLKAGKITDIWEFSSFMENSMLAYDTLHDLLNIPEEDREAASEWLWEYGA